MDKEKLKALGIEDSKADEVLKLFADDEAKRQEAGPFVFCHRSKGLAIL